MASHAEAVMNTAAEASSPLSGAHPGQDAIGGALSDRHQFAAKVQDWLDSPPGPCTRVLMYVRPDDYARIDERLGPLASEDLLCNLGQFLSDHLGRGLVVARFGGNIFTVLIERPTLKDITAAAEALRAAIADSIFEVGPYSTSMTASIGLIELSQLVPDALEALSLAQAAARRARDFGGDRVELDTSLEYSEGDKAATLRLTNNIRRALDDNAFQLVYQPMASISQNAYTNYDVLVRMQDEEGEAMLPGQFLPQAESTGLMPAIDRWVIEQALRAAAARWADGKKSRVFLRVSQASLHDPEFFDWLGLETLKHTLDPEGIVLQISESTAEGNFARARELGHVCQNLHFKMCMANAGVSRKGLKLVEQLPLDYLSVDGGLMQDRGGSCDTVTPRQLISAGKNKGIDLIASRVENARELAKLVNLGIDYIVGYHVHEPVDYMMDDVKQV